MSKQRTVLMVGPALDAPGGMSAVAQTYAQSGWFAREGVRYLSSYEGPGWERQLRVFGRAAAITAFALLRGRVRLLHVHSAARGSFWRKALLCAMARLARRPYVFHVHSGEFPTWLAARSQPLQAVVRWTLRGAARVLVLTPAWADALQRATGPLRCAVAWNPVPPRAADLAANPAEPAPEPREAPLVLFLGRLREKKGVHDLLNAWPAVLAAHPNARLMLGGDGELAAAAAQARALGVEGSVELPGWLAGAAKAAALRRATVFVLPSYFEGLPISLLEAMAAGVPVIATPVGGVPDLIEAEQNGLLVPVGDPLGLSQALLRLLGDASLARRLVTAAEFTLRRHDVDAVCAALSALYAEVDR